MSALDIVGSLAAIRPSFQADGADVELVSFEGHVAVIRLVLDKESCDENCVLPKPALERLLFAALSKADRELARVEVIDPRVTNSG